MKAYVIAHSTDLKSVNVYAFTSKDKANEAVAAVTEKEPSTVCFIASEEGDIAMSGPLMASLYRRVAGDASLTRFATKADGQRRLFSAMRDNGDAQEADCAIKSVTAVKEPKAPKEKKVKVPKPPKEKKVKEPKPPKEKKVKVPKPAKDKKWSVTPVDLEKKVKLLDVAANFKAGTKKAEMCDAFKKGYTAKWYTENGFPVGILRWAIRQGWIEIA
jgi:hypothetical protein